MLRQVFIRTGPRTMPVVGRSIHVSALARAIDPKNDKGPKRDLSEGHTTDKSHGLDVQNAAANKASREKSAAGGSGEAQPFDTARQGGQGGESKAGEGEGTGSLKDHRGGVPGGESEMGGKEDAAGGTVGDSLKKAAGMGGKRSFSTSAFAFKDPLSKPKSPRAPAEKNLHGDQNAHLKHKDAKAADKGKGNAAEDPHLPSKSKAASGGKGAKGVRHFSTTSVARKDNAPRVGSHDAPEKADGYVCPLKKLRSVQETPSEALPPHLKSAYDPSETQPSAGDLKSKLETGYSSTAVDPPNEALRKAALDGTLPKKNPQPHGGIGKKGSKKAWKDRGV